MKRKRPNPMPIKNMEMQNVFGNAVHRLGTVRCGKNQSGQGAAGAAARGGGFGIAYHAGSATG